VRAVVLVPRRADHGRRDMIWKHVRKWLQQNHPEWEIFEGHDDGPVFSLSKARNDAARKAGSWDVAVILDSDTIAEPEVLKDAVIRASMSTRLWIAGDIRMCLSKKSSDQILHGGLWFPRPDGHLPKNGANESIYGEPSSSVMAVSRELWDAVGGYVESMQGYGYEDLVFLTSCNIFGDGVSWIPDSIMYHFWHEKSRLTDDTERNYKIWKQLDGIARNQNARQVAKIYLESLGHTVNV